MKIGVVTTSYPRHAGDHAGNFVGAQVDALRALGHDVDVLAAHTLDTPASSLFADAGAPDALERGSLATYAAAARFALAQTRAVHARIATWDVVIAHWLAPSALTTIAALTPSALSGLAAVVPSARSARTSRRTPLLAIAHGGDLHTLRRLRLLAPALQLLHAADARLVFVSSELRDIARAAAPWLGAWLDGALVQPMGIDVARFAAIRAARRESAPPSPPRRVLVVARLVPVKGVDVAVRAMEYVRAPARLVLAGDGPERARLEELARDTSTSASIEWRGRVNADARDALLRDAACVVIPSRVLPNGRSEGTPMIALEALAADVPVIASDVGGLRDIPGIVRVRSDEPRELAAAIDGVLDAASVNNDAPGDGQAPLDVARFDHRHVTARLLAYAVGDRAPGASSAPAHESSAAVGGPSASAHVARGGSDALKSRGRLRRQRNDPQ